MKPVRRVSLVFALLSVVSMAVAWWGMAGDERWSALAFGWTLFGLNFLLLSVLGLWVLESAAPRDVSARGPGFGVMFLFLLKVVFLGGGAYIGLALLRLSALWFVAGVVAGLILVTLVSTALSRGSGDEP